MRFDIDLFCQLQEEYREKPIVPKARGLDSASLMDAARARVAGLDKRLGGIAGCRILEVGCGRGHVTQVLKDNYGCDAVGVDITEYSEWESRRDLDFYAHDIASMKNDFLGTFDAIVSFAVWEHVEHPFTALKATRQMLKPDGQMYLAANLYRGPKASHRYREIFFPWPHLLFQNDVFLQYYHNVIHKRSGGAAWVNRLTTAHYERYFDILDFDVEKLWWSPINFDRDFYNRFEDVLGRYPIYDLERDFIYAIVKPGRTSAPGTAAGSSASVTETEPGRVVQGDRTANAAVGTADRAPKSEQLIIDDRDRLASKLVQAEKERDILASELLRAEKERARLAKLQKDVDRLTAERDRAVRRLADLHASRSWKVTEPLRRVKRRLP